MDKIKNKYLNLTKKKNPRKELQKRQTNSIISSMKAYRNINDGKGGPGDTTLPNFNLTQGMRGEDVKQLQLWLISQGESIPDGATGYFGNQTRAALDSYNKKHTSQTSSMASPTQSLSSKYLISFIGDPNASVEGEAGTIWLVDPDTKSIVPFVNQQAFNDYYGSNAQAAYNSINFKKPESILPGGEFSNYVLLESDYGIKEGKQQKQLDFSPGSIISHYGKTISDEANSQASMVLDGWIKLLKSNLADSGLSQSTIDNAMNDKVTVAGYISALAYGGYTPMDVYMDLKSKDALSKGDTSISNIRAIDPNYIKSDYISTSQGILANTKLGSLIPGKIGSLDRSIFSSALSQMPESFYQATFPSYFDVDSPEFKQKMSEVTSLLHDSILQSISANTLAEKEAADFIWKNTRDQIEKKYGISLSDNALSAWNELQSLESSASEAGLSGSGIANEKLVKALELRRTQADRLRDQKEQETLSSNYNFYKTNASPEDIQKLNAEDYDKGLPREQWRSVQWGLAPSTYTTFDNFLKDFRSKYPESSNLSDSEVKARYYDPTYDENGNYRSSLYQTKFNNDFKTTYGYDPSGIPTTSLTSYQSNVVQQNALKEIEKNEAWKTTVNPLTSKEPVIPASEAVMPADAAASLNKQENKITTQPTQSLPTQTQTSTNTLTQEQRDAITKQLAEAKKQAESIQSQLNTMNKSSIPSVISGSTTPVVSSTPTTTKKKYTTLYDYYTQQGMTMPSYNSAERLALANKAGISSGYIGSAQQNQQILDYLNR